MVNPRLRQRDDDVIAHDTDRYFWRRVDVTLLRRKIGHIQGNQAIETCSLSADKMVDVHFHGNVIENCSEACEASGHGTCVWHNVSERFICACNGQWTRDDMHFINPPLACPVPMLFQQLTYGRRETVRHQRAE
ncbi:Hypothetical Protein FCC1311_009332 [Hondaea fermentalgiana]|uniref:Uncharacterized protein n=1 Tax=Hondaea fermentalgiana TaxID=2315210 RepID=A0A2R5G2F5_9STRA|nr:Hypothetical Protein FCC1311_009332 [Hondaea fermentalgiana]|eukprot:GBG24715.1 Hypothetical Protein FCC1311_009332 [Hondaea fermentalgiana]